MNDAILTRINELNTWLTTHHWSYNLKSYESAFVNGQWTAKTEELDFLKGIVCNTQ